MTHSTESSSGAEPSIKIYPYAGWIPTANGRLSFRHIGETTHPSECIYANVATDDRRFILAYQYRQLSDVLFRSVIEYLCNISGDFWFSIAARSIGAPGEADQIEGSIFIYKSKDDWRVAEPFVRPTRNALIDPDLLT